MEELTIEQFDEKYSPQTNHIDEDASFGGCMYETYGEEIDYVRDLSETTQKVWTIIEGENDTIFYIAGFHLVNRLGFLVTDEEWSTGKELVKLDTNN